MIRDKQTTLWDEIPFGALVLNDYSLDAPLGTDMEIGQRMRDEVVGIWTRRGGLDCGAWGEDVTYDIIALPGTLEHDIIWSFYVAASLGQEDVTPLVELLHA